MPEPLKLLSVPPVTVTSDCVKSVLASDRRKVMVAVSPAFKALLLLLMAIVGSAVSTVMVTVLLASEPSALKLPAESLNMLEATLTTPLAVLPGVGVNMAL